VSCAAAEMVAVVTARSAAKKLTWNKRPNFFMTRSPRNAANHCHVPSAAYADAIYSEAQVTETSASVVMNPNLAK